jgi:hypothetical protein
MRRCPLKRPSPAEWSKPMKRIGLSVCVLAAAMCGAGGCASSKESSGMSAGEPAAHEPARRRGLMVAGDSLGRAMFSENHPTLATVPDRDR